MTNRLKVRFQFWRQTAAEWTSENPILLKDEPGFEEDTSKWKFGDGITKWNDLPYYSDGGSGGDLEFQTADGGLLFKIIGFDNGNLKGIPAALDPPGLPSGLAADVKLSAVTLHWTASSTSGVSYDIYRNGVKIGNSTGLTYKDLNIAAGQTYLYHLIAVDAYGQPSSPTTDISVFVDPTLNVAPSVVVTTWPSPLPSVGVGIIRVCGSDPDAQSLSYALSIDQDSIEPTDDPSIWRYRAVGGT